jgi:putative MATE family efflux protein
VVRVPNPVRLLLLGVGLGLARLGVISERRVHRTVELAWPRIVTGLARMSKNAIDVAMVGIALGPAAIAGVGFTGPYWGLPFTVGGGLAAGTIALVSQRFGADAHDKLGQAIRSSAALVTVASLPIATVFYLFPVDLITVLSNDPQTTAYGADYLRIVAFGVPFAALNLIGSRALIGVDDSWTAMILRGGGAVANVVINGVLIFGLDMGVVGAALGTVLSNVLVTAAFAVGLSFGWLPGIGTFPVTVSPFGRYIHWEEFRDIVEIGLPVVGRNSVWSVARFPTLAIVAMFGQHVVAAYIISRRIWGLMNTPGWGFGLAASSLVGQELGADDETTAEAYGREITVFAVTIYLVAAAITAAFADPIVNLFVDDPTSASVPVAIGLVYAASGAVVFQGVTSSVAGALDATGDTRWPFYSRMLGMFGLAIPLTYLGATTPLGITGLYLAFFAESTVPAAINYYRFSTGKWKAISREYRPGQTPSDD